MATNLFIFMLGGNHSNQVVYCVNSVKLSEIKLNEVKLRALKVSPIKLGPST
jgi:hypothetical protein